MVVGMVAYVMAVGKDLGNEVAVLGCPFACDEKGGFNGMFFQEAQ